MSVHTTQDPDLDLTRGVTVERLADGEMLEGHVGEESVLLARRGKEFFAIGAHCTHYHAPLAQGLVVGETVRCPWHHACFSLRTGEAVHAPALSPVTCWTTDVREGKVFVLEKVAHRPSGHAVPATPPHKIVIVGGGAAGFAAAEMLRRLGFQGSIVILSDDDAPPVDRPNLSKDFLAGTAPEDWIPMRAHGFYIEQGIDLRLKTTAVALDPAARELTLGDGNKLAFDRLLLATGAEPVRLSIPGMDLPHVHTLRTLADCRAIIARAASSQRAVVMGGSFIGLEVAASLRARGIEVHVVAPETRPMERVLGPELGEFVRRFHEEHGVIFHLGDVASAIEARRVILHSGGTIDDTDLVVAGVGVRPRLTLAENANLGIDRGVKVDAYLETSSPGIFAAGDIARWPDPHSGAAIRVEHWVVAQRQGQTAAINMLGGRKKFDAVPFFWSQHYDLQISYVGHAEGWDELTIDGDITAHDCVLRYKRQGRVLAVASIHRDAESLMAEAAMEQETA